MGTPNRVFRSPDPLDQLFDVANPFGEPVDQPNEIPVLEGSAPLASAEIRALRARTGLTQRQFAGWFGFSVATLRHWERGNRLPTGPALVLLYVIRENARVVLQAVRKARRRAPGALPGMEQLASLRAPPGFGDRPIPFRKRRRKDRTL